ncbi:MAG: 2-hydroxyacid dehydrogenase [Brevinematales bacterium]|jgi:D-lactate dehydrogenase
MKIRKIAFFDSKAYDSEYFDKLNDGEFGYELKYFKGHLTPDTIPIAKGYDAVCLFVNDVANAEIISSLKDFGIGLIAMRCAGYNNVDLKAAYGNVHVVRVPSYSPYAVAEHAVALMLTLNRKTHKAYYRNLDKNFTITGLLGFDMNQKTAGIIGTGQIGKVLIRILKGFGMKILAYDAFPDKAFAEKEGFEYTTLDSLYRQADIISLHCPLTPETQYMIDEKSIGIMKDGVMIINTSRGKLIKTKALIDGLKNKKIGYAGLDVYEEESEYFFEDKSGDVLDDDVLARLLSFNNVIVTSHQAFFTKEALTNIARTTLQNIKDYFEGNPLKNEICYNCGQPKKNCSKIKGGRCF